MIFFEKYVLYQIFLKDSHILITFCNYCISIYRSPLNITKDTKYYYSKKKNKYDKYSLYKNKITQITKDTSNTYGKRRICQELRNKYNIYISEYLVAKLMKECNICVRASNKRSKYSSYKGQIGKLVPNLLNRDFSTERPNQKIVTDISEFEVNSKRNLFFCFH